MNIEFNCIECGQLLAIDEKWRNTEIECPNCNSSLVPEKVIAENEKAERANKKQEARRIKEKDADMCRKLKLEKQLKQREEARRTLSGKLYVDGQPCGLRSDTVRLLDDRFEIFSHTFFKQNGGKEIVKFEEVEAIQCKLGLTMSTVKIAGKALYEFRQCDTEKAIRFLEASKETSPILKSKLEQAGEAIEVFRRRKFRNIHWRLPFEEQRTYGWKPYVVVISVIIVTFSIVVFSELPEMRRNLRIKRREKIEKAQKVSVSRSYLNDPNVTLVATQKIELFDAFDIPINKYERVEHLVTVLRKGDQINILRLGILTTKILVLTHNGQPVLDKYGKFLKGWIPSDFIDNEYFKVKEEN